MRGLDRIFPAVGLAVRELRSGLTGFRIFLTCIALGTAGLAGVGSVARGLVEGLSQNGRAVLGGDVDISLIQREATAEERAFLERRSDALSHISQMRTMARVQFGARAQFGARPPRGDDSLLVELKAVDNAYPLAGRLDFTPAQPLEVALAKSGDAWGGLVEEGLLDRLKLRVGDTLRVGAAQIVIRGVLTQEPDRVADGLLIAPRLLVAHAALDASGLAQEGSLVQNRYRVRLADAANTRAALAQWVEETNAAFPQAGWRVRDRLDSAPSVRRFIERIAMFLTLAGITALLVGGVGIANAVNAYLTSRRETIATLKCVGAKQGTILRLYLSQIGVLACLGVALGCALGACVPFAIEATAGALLPIPLVADVYPLPLAIAAVSGLLTAFLFSLPALAQAGALPPGALFRASIAPERTMPPVWCIIAIIILGSALVALTLAGAADRRFAIRFLIGAAGGLVFLAFVGRALVFAMRRLPPSRRAAWRIARASLQRPGGRAGSIVLALGLGLALLASVVLVDVNLQAQIRNDIPDRAPAFFLADIRGDQISDVRTLLEGTAGVARVHAVPMLRGRIVRVAGVPSERASVSQEAEWALRGDRGLTYADTPPENDELTEGTWWAEDYDGPPLVSLSEDIAQGLGVDVGDTITVNVLGREITATIANRRRVAWESLGINFVLVFSSSALAAAPHGYLATATMRPGARDELRGALVARWPNIVVIGVRDILASVSGLIRRIAAAARAASGATLLLGILVLAGALAVEYRQRLREAVILKTLGATRRDILLASLCEYGVLAGVASVAAVIAGMASSWFTISVVMDAPWQAFPLYALGVVLPGAIVTIFIGASANLRALSRPAAPVLRTA